MRNKNGLNRDDITLEFQEKLGELFFETAQVTNISELRAMSAEQVFSLMIPFMEKATQAPTGAAAERVWKKSVDKTLTSPFGLIYTIYV